MTSSEKSLSSGVPSYHKRAYAHNYRAPFIYHIILKKQDICEPFGSVRGDARIAPGMPGCACIAVSSLGHIAAKAIVALQTRHPILQIYQYMVMPDHIHILLRVKEWSEHHLDFYVNSLTNAVADAYSSKKGRTISPNNIFQPGYCDKPLLLGRSLDALYRYIRENPHRLAMRQQYPEFFQHTRRLEINGRNYDAYGYLFLVKNPDKEAVKISSKFAPDEKRRKIAEWLQAATEGSVLVSPFISPEEKAVRAAAEARGARIILITHAAFPERYKPSAHDFELCYQGCLMIITLGLPPKTPLNRSLCLEMNALAESIASL